MPETAYLIDVFSLLFQVFHAIPPMTGPSGQPTNAVFGFSRDLLGLLRTQRPEFLIAAMDSSGPSEREGWYPQYKANRDEMPADLQPQIPILVEVLQAFGVPMVRVPGWEADDIIATLTHRLLAEGHDVRIVTSDKDARQLLGPNVKIFNLRKNTYLDEAGLLADWGIRPDQVIDFQALVGDAVDNVPGVPLVGPKKAAALLNEFGDLEAVLANAEKAPGAKLRENLKTFADQARLSHRLVTLYTNLEFETPWDEWRYPRPNVPALQSQFRQLGFRRLIDEVAAFDNPKGESGTVPAEDSELGGLFAPKAVHTPIAPGPVGSAPELDVPAPPSSVSLKIDPILREQVIAGWETRRWQTVDTPELLADFVRQLAPQTHVCLDLESTHVDPLRARVVGWAFCWEPGEAWYVATGGPLGSQFLSVRDAVSALKPVLESPQLGLMGQNIKYDLLLLKTVGIEPPSVVFDSMVADYLLDAGARTHNLGELARKYLGLETIPIADLIGKGKNQKTMADVPVEHVAKYATEDAELVVRLERLMRPLLQEAGLAELFDSIEVPLIRVLTEMEYAGIRIDSDELKRQSVDLTTRLEATIREVFATAGHEFNIDSPIQLRKVLFDELKLPVQRKTKTGASTDQEVLEELAQLHELPKQIIEHRHLSKLKNTYVDALPQLVHPTTNRIHCSFNQVVAATGRLSCSDPNLQNIPVRTPEGSRIRQAFIPTEAGWQLVCADYSQIELRVLAHFSRDPVLAAAFADGIDIHSAVAAAVYSVPQSAVTGDMRRVAKAVNFGIIYGQSPFGLAQALGIPKDEATRIIDDYFRRHAGVTQFMEEVLNDCVATGYAKTILGRQRAIEGVRPEAIRNRNRTMSERTAINTVVQGSAADLIKRAMLNVADALAKTGHPGRLLLQIHDELVFETPIDATDSLIALVKQEMEHAMTLLVPLVVDVSAGLNWLQTETVSVAN